MGQTSGRWFLRRTCLCRGLREAATICADHPRASLLEEGLCSSIYDKHVDIFDIPYKSPRYTLYVSVLFYVPTELCHKGGVICMSEDIDISPGNLDSSLCFLQPSVSHDILS